MSPEASKDGGNIVTLSVASVLGLKGPVRFTPHGSTQKPHVILRRVVVSEDRGDGSQRTSVVRFSLFAAKRIEVKPGKEILLSIESNEFDNHPIVLEGDEGGSNEEDEAAQIPPEPKRLPTPPPIAMPPKMRKTWMRTKIEEPQVIVPLIQPINRSEIGIQAHPEYLTASAQARPTYASLQVQAQPLHKTMDSQTDPIPITKLADTQTTRIPSTSAKDTKPPLTAASTEQSITVIEDRSPSPMDLESPIQTPEFSPTLVPEMIGSLVLSPSPAPPLTSFTAQNSKPIPLQNAQPIALPFIKAEPVEETISWSTPSTAMKIPEKPKPLSSQPTPTTNRKPVFANPFVSAGYVTDFGGINNANAREQSRKSPPTKEVPPPVASTSKAPPPPPSKTLPPPPPSIPPPRRSPRKPSRFDQPGKSIQVKMEELDMPIPLSFEPAPTEPSPARKVIYERPTQAATPVAAPAPLTKAPVIPKGPRAMMAAFNTNQGSRPASPAISHAKPGTPPPAPEEIAHISNGPSSNPLGIRPSASQRVLKVAPSLGPNALIPPSVAKKRVVIGPKWGQKQVNGTAPTTNGVISHPTPAPPLSKEEIIAIKLEPIDLPPPPLLEPPPVPPPQSKWKRVVGDGGPPRATVKVATPTEARSPMQADSPASKTVSLKIPRTPSTVANAAPILSDMSLKERMAPGPSASAPMGLQQLLEQKKPENGKTLLDRVEPEGSAVTSLAKSSGKKKRKKKNSTQVNPIQTSSSTSSQPYIQPPPLVTSSRPRDSPSTSTPLAITPSTTLPTLHHPLPPKPGTTVSTEPTRRVIKREREPTPELSFKRQRRRRDFPWPTVRCNQVSVLTGRGDTAVRKILFSNDGSSFVCLCADDTIRIWSSKHRHELARIKPDVPVVALSWMDDDSVLLCLDEDGLLGRWIRHGSLSSGSWQWMKVFHAGRERPTGDGQVCLAYKRGRIAVSYPKDGVSVWLWQKGHWQKQRSILRQNVTALKFIEDGAALIGGTQDGVLWRSDVPNGTLRAYAFLRSRINSLDMSPGGNHVLVAQVGGFARLVSMRRSDQQGMVEKSYSYKATEARSGNLPGAVHVNSGDKVMFGTTDNCVLLWDQNAAEVVCGLEHDEGEIIEAFAAFEGANREGYIVTGTKSGCLAWWSQPLPKGAFDR